MAQAVDDDDVETAKRAALTLAEIESPEAKQYLDDLASRVDHPTRVWIAVAMHRSDSAGTTERFKKLLQEPNAELRRQAITAVAELTSFDATSIYVQTLEDTDAEVRKTTITALSKKADPRAIEAVERHLTGAIDDLLPQLTNTRKVPETMHQLRQLGPAVAPFLLERLIEDPQPRTQNYVGAVIGQLKNPEVVPRLIEKLSDDGLDRALRFVLEDGGWPVSASAASPAIVPLADHSSVTVREMRHDRLLMWRHEEGRQSKSLSRG